MLCLLVAFVSEAVACINQEKGINNAEIYNDLLEYQFGLNIALNWRPFLVICSFDTLADKVEDGNVHRILLFHEVYC